MKSRWLDILLAAGSLEKAIAESSAKEATVKEGAASPSITPENATLVEAGHEKLNKKGVGKPVYGT